MKKILSAFFILTLTQLHAQKNIKGLINAEKKFAAYSVEHGTKDAFLKFLDSTGIVFDQGKPVNGIEIWNRREKRPGVLNWYPQFAEISSSNDLGYTTGPWMFQPRTLQDSIVARGQYTTIWRIDKNGEWKFLVDLGATNTPPAHADSVQQIVLQKEMKNEKNSLKKLLEAENEFIQQYQGNVQSSYKRFLSAKSVLNRNKYLPATTSAEQEILIAATPASMQYQINGSGISRDGRLGYVYGTTMLGDKAENYLRIWRNENGRWKIAVEVLRY